MNKILFLLSILFLMIMIFIDYKQGINYNSIPQFTEKQMQIICREEGL